MKRALFLGLGFAWVALAGEKPGAPALAEATTQSVVIHEEDVVPIHVSLKEVTLIVLPEKEKAIGVFCGDRSYWNVDVIPGAERYIAVKASKAGLVTDIHVVTDHNNSYTFQAIEGGGGPVALKIFVRPFDASSLDKLPVFVSVAEADELKRQVAEAQAALKRTQAAVAAEIKTKTDEIRANYPDTVRINYTFKKNKPPFNVQAVWHDDKFTYIRAAMPESAALYEIKDSKPNLIQYELRPDGLYFVPKILDSFYMQLGKQKLDIWK